MLRFLALIAVVTGGPALAQAPPKPLFATDAPITIVIDAPIRSLASGSREREVAHPGTLSVGTGESLPIRISTRGLTRRKRETCDFPPLRVSFDGRPPATSLFAGQKNLKLVTHCRSESAFQKHLLLEYAAYRAYNLLTPASFRVRLAQIEYRNNGKPLISRVGFFLEDIDDVAKRNAMKDVNGGPRLPLDRVDAVAAGRVAMFEYLIANVDWAMSAGPEGDNCCHNIKPISPSGTALRFVPVPYDFDYSGLVDAPYAVIPDELRASRVTQRIYRGYCRHNPQALAAASELRRQMGPILAAVASVPGLDARSQRKATEFLRGFFAQAATDQSVSASILKSCRP